VSAHSAGAYTATLLVMVNEMKGGGPAPAPPPSPAWANFTRMMECMPESSRCYSVYSVVVSILVLASLHAVAGYTTCTVLLQASLLIYCTVLYNGTH
jgi:hypothetical protein